MRPLYISATVQDSGKTCVSLGLMQVLRSRGLDPGYIKPVGQHYVKYQDENIDEDAVLVHKVFNFKDESNVLSPIAIEKGFTRKFIMDPDVSPLEKKILQSAQLLHDNHKMVIVEGTGHAGVGSCFGLSNARVAELLDSKVVIVTAGGIGKPIDEIALSLALFKQHNVKVMGVILNKVLYEKYDKIKNTVARGLKHMGTELLGVIPYEPSLSAFTMGQLADEFKYKVVSGESSLSNLVLNTVVAAMEPQNALNYIKENTLLITPGDRIDNILVAIILMSKFYPNSGGILLTGGFKPDPKIVNLLKTSNIPVLLSKEDTFKVSKSMSNLGFKIRGTDNNKIKRLHTLVDEFVEIDKILTKLEK